MRRLPVPLTSPDEAPPTDRVERPSSPSLVDAVPPIEVVGRVRTYELALDALGRTIEVGAGRYARAFAGVERWLQSKTDHHRDVVIKILQRRVPYDQRLRFQLEKSILERVQGHANIVELLASGENDVAGFIPPHLREHLENDFLVLERLDLTLEERLKGTRDPAEFDDLLAVPMAERVFRVLDYVMPVAAALEFAHLERNVCHRDVKPANILLRLPNPRLAASQLVVKLADFNAGKSFDEDLMMTRCHAVPGTLFFQSPEQETNSLEILVDVRHGDAEVEFFEDFYTDVHKNDTFAVFNHAEQYGIIAHDRARKRILLERPYGERTETSVRGRIVKSVGRPADIYSLGALLYYLISGAYANPKSLYDAFRQFLEYKGTENNTIAEYLEYQYGMIRNLRTPRQEGNERDLAPSDRFFSYKHYLDGNGEVIDLEVMQIVARAMIRTKPDSYCHAADLETEGISTMVRDIAALSLRYGLDPRARTALLAGVQRARPHGVLRRLFGRRPRAGP